jgi:hypothetical protein
VFYETFGGGLFLLKKNPSIKIKFRRQNPPSMPLHTQSCLEQVGLRTFIYEKSIAQIFKNFFNV